MKTILLLILFMSFLPAEAGIDKARELFQLGNEQYDRGDFAAAEGSYRGAVEEGLTNANLFYNLANSLYRNAKLGQAILYYEKAAKLAPGDPDIAYNLRFARAQILDKVPTPQPDVFSRFFAVIQASYSLEQGLWALLALFSAFFLVLTWSMFVTGATRLSLRVLSLFLMLGLIPLGVSAAWKIRTLETIRHAVVLSPSTEIRSGPGESFQVLAKVHEGTRFELMENKGEWVAVKLPNGQGGYVLLEDLGKI